MPGAYCHCRNGFVDCSYDPLALIRKELFTNPYIISTPEVLILLLTLVD